MQKIKQHPKQHRYLISTNRQIAKHPSEQRNPFNNRISNWLKHKLFANTITRICRLLIRVCTVGIFKVNCKPSFPCIVWGCMVTGQQASGQLCEFLAPHNQFNEWGRVKFLFNKLHGLDFVAQKRRLFIIYLPLIEPYKQQFFGGNCKEILARLSELVRREFLREQHLFGMCAFVWRHFLSVDYPEIKELISGA